MPLIPRSIPQAPNRVALITGAASTLGSAISLKMAGQGMRIALHYGKSFQKTRQFQKVLTRLGVETLLLQADLSDPPQIQSMVSQLIRRWGRLDVLVNNASIFKPTPLTEENWSKWEKLMKINSISPCLLAASARLYLQRSKGCIINITDIYGEMPVLKNHGAYSASKAALLFLTKYLAIEWAPDIRVNAVSPGVISFPGNYNIPQRRRLIQKTALKREGKPEEVADAVWFLVSNRFITGQILKVDGGRFIS